MAFIEELKKIYEEKKDSKNPPSYIKIIEELLKLEGEIDEIKKCWWLNE